MGAPDFDLSGLLVAGIVIGAILAAMVMFGLPWLWELAKPWLHAITG